MGHQGVDEVGVMNEKQQFDEVDRLHEHSNTEDIVDENSDAEGKGNEQFNVEDKVDEHSKAKKRLDEHSDAEDRRRYSLASSSSIESETTDLSFEDPNREDRSVLGSSSMLETPPTQMMERQQDTFGYRIPSHVFTIKSNALNAEWSTCSNESLFSIHTGNMSFTRDQFSWLLKSGELSMPGGPGDIRKSGELPPPSPKIVPKFVENKDVDVPKSGDQMPPAPKDTLESGEEITVNHFKTSVDEEFNTEAVKQSNGNAATSSPNVNSISRKDDMKSETSKTGRRISVDDATSASDAKHSDASGQSFVFPVLAEVDREKSVNSGQSRTNQQKNSSASNKDVQKTTTGVTSAPQAVSESWCSRILSCFLCCR